MIECCMPKLTPPGTRPQHARRMLRRWPVAFAMCLLTASAHASERDWAFMQSVGGMAIEAPVRVAPSSSMHKTARWQLPVRADVSGLTAVTRPPSSLNSALACTQTKAELRGHMIALRVLTGLMRSGLSSVCPPADLGAIAPGNYRVVYGQEAQPLGELHIP